MVFSSSIFLFSFLPVVFISYFLIKEKFSNIVLLVASLFFYSWGEPKNIILMIAAIVLNYALGIGLEQYKRYSKLFLGISVVYNIGVLFVYKYLNFTVNTINEVFSKNIEVANIALPIGISFFTFQILSYIIDVYRGSVKAQRNIIHLALYISLFPQLIAGPIVRYIDVEKQIVSRCVTLDKIYDGIIRFCVGFSKKILIADQLAPLVEVAFSGEYPSIYGNWIGIIAYTLQIYFDFSGYSDMAIGLGKIFGFEFLENFNYPYISRSIKEFWRRWHMSLSSWFRDYLYIPLGGSRSGEFRTYVNLIIVFFVTGLWHGASFNFIVWGLFYVVFLIVERLGFDNILTKFPVVLQHMYSLLIIMLAWVFFRAATLGEAVKYIVGMFVPAGNDWINLLFIMDSHYWFCIFIGIIFAIPHRNIIKKLQEYKIGQVGYDSLIILIFIIAISYMIGSGFSPFLYFRF